MSDIPKDTDTSIDSSTSTSPEKLSPKGIAAMQGQEVTVDDVQSRVEQLRAETEANESAELAALKANPIEPVTTIAPDPSPQTEPVTPVIPEEPTQPSFRPGYHAEKPASPEGEPLDEKPTREKPLSPEGGYSSNPERGG